MISIQSLDRHTEYNTIQRPTQPLANLLNIEFMLFIQELSELVEIDLTD
jgi:hypothetical protein